MTIKRFYSPSKLGFYSDDIHGENIPSDAIEIEESDYFALFEAQSKGKQIQPGPDGRPVAVDSSTPVVPSA